MVKPTRSLQKSTKPCLEVLREDLGLTGTKRGCDLGACGACTVLINGKAHLSCLPWQSNAQGKDVLTIEGFEFIMATSILCRRPLSRKGLFSVASVPLG